MQDSALTIPMTAKVQCALELAQHYGEELVHLKQVAGLSAMLFRAFDGLHQMGSGQRELLCCAALLHDIGISISYSAHHKHSLRLIRAGRLPALTAAEREIVANIARYHRKATPTQKHKAFGQLTGRQQHVVRRLAAILRLADGLDRAHENAVVWLETSAIARQLWAVRLFGRGDLAYAAWGAERKAGLFQDTYGVELRFEPAGPPPDAHRT